MQTPADRIRLVQAESERFKHYIHALPADAWSCPSACDGWEVQDVVAHLAGGAEFFAASIARGLEGDTAPLGGRRPAGSANAAQAASMIAQSARALRQRAGDQLLATFDTANDHLNQVFAGLRPQDWETPCYHPWRIIPARQFVDLRLQELALHEWDIRSRLNPSASLAPAGLPAMMDLIATSLTSGFLRWAFRPGDRLPTHLRYRFAVTGVVPAQTDIVVEGETARLEAAQQVPATVTFRCDTATYVLLMYGRLSIAAAMADTRLEVQGDSEAATRFGQWFQGI
jgi:uncharacterized protein (TIGR03083 family)